MRFARMGAATLLALGISATGANAETLSTTFVAGEVGAGGWTNLFNLSFPNSAGITVNTITVNSATNGPATVNIYAHPLTYVGNEGSSLGWTLISTGTG